MRSTATLRFMFGLLAFGAFGLFAADKPEGVSPEDAKFTAGKEVKILDPETGGVGWYCVYTPKDYKPDRESPLIFCYHGKNNDPKSWPFKELTDGSGYIVVGMEYKDHENPNPQNDIENLKRIRKYVESKLKVNQKLIFMGGFSQGGWSTSSFSALYLNQLAGLIITGAGGSPGGKDIKLLKGMPVFVGVGEKDPANPKAKEARDAYKAKGADVTFEEFPGLEHNCDTKDKVFKEWLLKVGPQNQMIAAVSKAKAAEKAGKLGEAFSLYSAAGKMNGGQDAEAAAQAIAAPAQKKLADAEALVSAKKYSDATKTLASVVEVYAGSPMADTAQQRIQQIQTDPGIKADIEQALIDSKADAVEASALNAEKQKEFAKALALYETYTTQYPKATRIEAVKAHYAELKSNKSVQSAAMGQVAERECKSWLAMADSFIKNGAPDDAKPELQKILTKYGDTSWAAEAKKRLATLK